MRAIIRLLRPADWTKNLFVFPALVFSLPRRLSDARDMELGQTAALWEMIFPSLAIFAAFCCVASGFYAINDVLDAQKDRCHPVKRMRPVASGQIAPMTAILTGVALIMLSFLIGWTINLPTLLMLLSYAALQIAYNLRLKRVILVDVTTLAIGFTLRAAAGAAAIEVKVSIWLLLCVFFLCLFLAFIKRLCDLASAERSGAADWTSPAGYDSRDELNWLLSLSGVLAVLTYVMYTLSDQTRELFGVKAFGFTLLTPLVVIAIHRFYRRASLGLSDSPLSALFRDRAVMASVALFAIGIGIALFVPQVEEIFESMFFTTGETP